MKNKNKTKKYLGFIFLSLFLFTVGPAFAEDIVQTDYNISLGNSSPLEVAVNIINWGLGILALVAVIICLWGGITWLLSRGNEEKVEQAQKILRNGVIGLLIILAAWGIAYYLINKLLDFTNAQIGENTCDGCNDYHYSTNNPFYIDHTNPRNNDIDVSLCHLVAVTFSLPIQTDSITSSTFIVKLSGLDKKTSGQSCATSAECESSKCDAGLCVGDQMAGTFAFSEEPSYAAVWYPDEDYQPSETYHVEIKTTVVGLDEETTDTYNLSSDDSKLDTYFTTGTTTDIIPPKVDVVSLPPFPGDESTDICRNTPIQTSFSESLDPASLKDENVRLYNYTDESTAVLDEIDVSSIRTTSIGGEPDDTLITSPEETLVQETWYGLSLYSGLYNADATSTRTNYTDAIRDTCGNPISGDFDDDMEGAPTDDFTETTSAASASGWDHQWTFKTGVVVNCTPRINSISYSSPAYYSEDTEPYNDEKTGSDQYRADSLDTDLVEINGDYLYPFNDAIFYNSIGTANNNCFDKNHSTLDQNSGCFVSYTGTQQLVVRVPAGSQSGGNIIVENTYGSDSSDDIFYVSSPFIRYLSPSSGPVEQYVTIKGNNFGDYDPTDSTSTKGKVYFDDVEAETPCADGWDDDQIIVKVPNAFEPDDTPYVQVITAAEIGGKYSNQKKFTITDEEPGPGLCALDPDCSNTGEDDVTIIGQNFSVTPGKVFFYNSDETFSAAIQNWNGIYGGSLTVYSGYNQVVTDSEPTTTQNDYNIKAAISNSDGGYSYSNGLDFDIPCSTPPEVFIYSSCDLTNTFYLPNPRAYEDEACVNSAINFAFTDDMFNDIVEDLVKVYECGNSETYLSSNCSSIPIDNDISSGFLNAAYLGGSGSDITEYENFEYTPVNPLSPSTWYRVVIPQDIYNNEGITLAAGYEWHFRVRADSADCAVDIVDLRPAYQIETVYDSDNPSPKNYSVTSGGTTTDYTYKASPYNSACFILRNDFDWHWVIDNSTNTNIIKFSNGSEDQDITGGYNDVYMQGDGADNFGRAYVQAGPTTETGTYDSSWVNDSGTFDVDFGYCTSDADCQIAGCTTSTCDMETSHCTPVINSFTPTSAGPGGCTTVNGCYFGPSRLGRSYCTCTDPADSSRTCQVPSGSDSCRLSTTSECTLSSPCAEADAVYAGQGAVAYSKTSGDTTAEYLSEDLCGTDTWNDSSIITELPTSITADNYNIKVTSYYGLTISSTGQLTVGSATTPCLCRADPAYGNEQDNTTLYGKYFNSLISTSILAKFASFSRDYTSSGTLSSLDSSIYGSDAWSFLTTIPKKATSDDEAGVKLVDGSIESNAIGFGVTCDYNSDCSTHCCEAGYCQPEEECNDCLDKTDCEYGDCDSECVDGMCQPFIISVNPDSGNVGQPTTVFGCHFGSFYSSADGYDPYSRVTFNNTIEADFACDEADTWNNEEIKIKAPDGIFADSDEATVSARQVYEDAGGSLTSQESISNTASCIDNECDNETDCEKAEIDGGCASTWRKATFTKNEKCDGVDLPVLCDLDEANGPYSTTTNLIGDNFYDAATTSFCRCVGTDGETCNITPGVASCVIERDPCFADPEDESILCSSSLSTNNGYNYYVETGCSDAIYTTEAACTENGGTWGSVNKCRCVNADNTNEYCYIDVSSTSCTISDETCYVDLGDTLDVCDATDSSYQTIGGNVSFAYNQNASTWSYHPDTSYVHAPYETYINATVPTTSETGSVYAQAIKSDSTVCESNGINFEVTCDNCSNCGDNEEMMCNLYSGSGAYGICTSDKQGYCEDYPESCCGNTGCRATTLEECDLGSACTSSTGCLCTSSETSDVCTVTFNESTCDITDGGICYERPLLLEDDSQPANGEENICPNAQLFLAFDSKMTVSDTAYYTDYIKLMTKATYDSYSVATDFSTLPNLLDSAEYYSENALLLTQSTILDSSTIYYIVIKSDPDTNEGLVSSESGVSLGCTADQIADGICTEGNERFILEFTTSDDAGGCPPDYVDLSATNDDFIDADYTFISAAEEQEFIASVYYNGDDDVQGNEDDQAIIPIDNYFSWDYSWSPVYNSIEDLASSECPSVGIITDSSFGTCSCTIGQCDKTLAEESCTITYNEPYCEISTTEKCYFESSGTVNCSEPAGCYCTIAEESCTIAYEGTSCETATRGSIETDSASGMCDYQDTDYTESQNDDDKCTIDYDPENPSATCTTENDQTCYLDPADSTNSCDPTDEEYSEGEFEENNSSQTATAGNKEGEGWIMVTITGDGTATQNWIGSKSDSQYVTILYCDSYEYLSTYTDTVYHNFKFAYCRGSDADDLLPDIDDSSTSPTIKDGIAAGEDYLTYYLFTNSDNEDLIGIKVFSNDIDNDTSNIVDALPPGLWADLRLDFGSYSEETIDDYEAVKNDYSSLIAATNLSSGVLYPNIYMLSINKGAESDTKSVLEKIKESISFNTNSDFNPVAPDDTGIENLGCQEKKEKVIQDTRRLTDIGEINYLLAKYYYADADGDGTNIYPSVSDGSYIRYLTNSVWSSWDSVLGNELGQSLPTDPDNGFADTATNCAYDETDGPYYDVSGNCWDPVNRDYKCPSGSYVYQYIYDNTSGNYNFYGNFELTDEDWDWEEDTTYDPCTADSAIDEYSSGCACFNFQTSNTDLADVFYGTCDTSINECRSDSGFMEGVFCDGDEECQILP